MGKIKDLTRQRFGRLIALKPTDERYRGSVVWECECKCGAVCFIGAGNLRSDNTQSCGCLCTDKTVERSTKHGMSNTSVYKAWQDMKSRCNNINNKRYKDYGGRGIKVSEEFHDFQTWYEHIGPRPGPEYSQDRRDNEGNYERGNIRWATCREQVLNSRPNSCGPRKQYWFRAWHKDMMYQFMSNNQSQFEKKWGLGQGSISLCLHDKQKTHRGWIFQSV